MITFSEVAQALARHQWTFAKTMPQNPHWYTLRKNWTEPPAFEAVVQFIRDAGYRTYYRGRPYTCLNINGFKYWTMGAPLPQTILINRAEIDETAAYDPIAPFYDGYHADPEALAENAKVIGALGKLDGATLDIGCGTGLLLDEATIAGEYLGIDPSRAMLDMLKRKHPNADVFRVPLEEFWSPARWKNIVGLFGSPSYVGSAGLLRIPDMLAPGGRYFLMFYRDDYYPVTHLLAGADVPYFRHPPDLLPGESSVIGNFRVLEGP